MSDKPELTKEELTKILADAFGGGVLKPDNQWVSRVPDGGVHTCINGHKWDNPADARKCCTGAWRPYFDTRTGRQELIADHAQFQPLGDELARLAKKGNKHSLGDELFGKVKK